MRTIASFGAFSNNDLMRILCVTTGTCVHIFWGEYTIYYLLSVICVCLTVQDKATDLFYAIVKFKFP